MATTRNFTSSYAGDAIRAYILKALIGGETLSTAGINIQTGIKYKRVIKKFTSADIVQSGGCSFTPAGTLTISEGVLEPKKIKVNEQICFEDLYNLWDAEDMSDGMNNEDVPQAVVDAMTNEFVGRVAEAVEIQVWQGDLTGATGTYLDLIDGYEKLLDDGSPATVTLTAITSANVVTALNAVTAAQPKAIMIKPASSKVIFTSPAVVEAYQQNLAAQGVNTTADEQAVNFHGMELRQVGGISANKIVLGMRDNFYFGTDLMSDYVTLKALDQRDVDGSEYVNWVLKCKGDVALGWSSEIVYYS